MHGPHHVAQKLRTTGFPLNCLSVTGCFVTASISLKSGAAEPGKIVSFGDIAFSLDVELRVISKSRSAGLVAYRTTPNIRPSAAPASSSFLCENDCDGLDIHWVNSNCLVFNRLWLPRG